MGKQNKKLSTSAVRPFPSLSNDLETGVVDSCI